MPPTAGNKKRIIMKGKRKYLPCGESISNSYAGDSSSSRTWCLKDVGILDMHQRMIEEVGHYYECEICDNGGELLRCDTCPNAYHLRCLRAPFEGVPNGNWKCLHCSKREDIEMLVSHLQSSSSKKKNSTSKVNESTTKDINEGTGTETTIQAREPKVYRRRHKSRKVITKSENVESTKSIRAHNPSEPIFTTSRVLNCSDIQFGSRGLAHRDFKDNNKQWGADHMYTEAGRALKEKFAKLRARQKRRLALRITCREPVNISGIVGPKPLAQFCTTKFIKAFGGHASLNHHTYTTPHGAASCPWKCSASNVSSFSSLGKDVVNMMMRSDNLVNKFGMMDAWFEEELDALWIGVRRHGEGNWETMLRDPTLKFSKHRTSGDLLERWKKERQQILISKNLSGLQSTNPLPGVSMGFISPNMKQNEPNFLMQQLALAGRQSQTGFKIISNFPRQSSLSIPGGSKNSRNGILRIKPNLNSTPFKNRLPSNGKMSMRQTLLLGGAFHTSQIRTHKNQNNDSSETESEPSLAERRDEKDSSSEENDLKY